MARRPRTTAEREALTLWQAAYPYGAMERLAAEGYGPAQRAEFLRAVVRLPEEFIPDYYHHEG